MSYYKDQLSAYNDLDKILDSVLEKKADLDIEFIIYELTKVHAVSAKSLKSRIQQFSNTHNLKIVDNTLVMKVEE